MVSLLSPGTLVQERYRIERLIGQGGFGAVYAARDVRLGRRVALKQLLRAGDRVSRQFEREARLLANLVYPALPRVTDYFGTDAGQFLVMDFVTGDDLGTLLLARNAPFALDAVLGWAFSLLDALHYLHSRQPPILHRDIKPQNLKLQADGSIMLLDFGLAKGTAGDSPPSTAEGSLLAYTRGYAPPEQVEGTGTDARSDLYALGATLHCLVTNVPPPEAHWRLLAAAKQAADPLRPAHALNAAVPAAISQVVQQAVALEPDERPPSAQAMRTLLQSARATHAHASPMLTEVPGDSEQPAIATEPTVLDAPPPAQAADTRLDAVPADDALEERYTQALAAFYTERWDEAITQLGQLAQLRPAYKDAASKLRQATTQRQLEQHWHAGAAAAAAGNWTAALAAYEQVAALDGAYRDVAAHVAEARRQHSVAQLYAEAHARYAAGEWAAVVNVLERRAALDAGFADPDGLRDGARAKLAEQERRQQLQMLYRHALQLLEEGKLEAARDGFTRARQLDAAYGDTGALLERIERDLAKHEQRATVERLSDQGQAALAAGDVDGARQGLDELARIAPNSSAAAQLRADLESHSATRSTAQAAPPNQSQPAAPAEAPVAQTTLVPRSEPGPASAATQAAPTDRTAVAPPAPTAQHPPRQIDAGIWMARIKPAVPVWVWWTLASVAGLVCLRLPTYLVGVFVNRLYEQYKDGYAWLFDDYILVAYDRLLFPALLLAGATALGYLQCRVLERYVPPARWWIWATAAAWLLAVLLWALVPAWATNTYPDDLVNGKLHCDNHVMCGDLVVPIVLAGVINGALLGLGQWLFLRLRVRAASWWLLGRGLGYAAAAYFLWRSGHSAYSFFGSIDFSRLNLVLLVEGVSKAATEGTFWQGWVPLVVAEAIAGVAMAMLLANNRRDAGPR